MTSNILEGAETVWTNGLGSKMKLNADGDGNLTGTYQTTVGHPKIPQPLVGKYNPCEACPSLGWVVQWKPDCNSPDPKKRGWSTTTWTGQLLQKADGTWMINAKWSLTNQTTLKKSWKDTVVGCGVFTQIIQSVE